MNNDNKNNWIKSLALFYRVSGWIVFPVLAAALVGKWLDEKYDKEPWLFLTSIAIAFIITCVGITKEALKAIKDAEDKNK
ncbi:MAG: AtpZ/AtpI family protein [Candidatus Moranbacteria bacterium]|nr:AtpZ/AtpI family protein [Candidatus Moranbacteria bacterium]